MENNVGDHNVKHLESNDPLNDDQFGFISGRSCNLQLVDCVEHCFKLLDESHSDDVLCLHFAKLASHPNVFSFGLGIL